MGSKGVKGECKIAEDVRVVSRASLALRCVAAWARRICRCVSYNSHQCPRQRIRATSAVQVSVSETRHGERAGRCSNSKVHKKIDEGAGVPEVGSHRGGAVAGDNENVGAKLSVLQVRIRCTRPLWERRESMVHIFLHVLVRG